MIDYKFGDKVLHPDYGRCVFGGYLDDECIKAVIWNGNPDGYMLADVSDLAPADPRIIKIDGVWYLVYTPLDVAEAREIGGKFALFSRHAATDYDQSGVLKSIEAINDPDRPYYGAEDRMWQYVAVPIEHPEPKEEPKPEPPVTIQEFCLFLETHTDWYENVLDQIKKEREAKG